MSTANTRAPVVSLKWPYIHLSLMDVPDSLQATEPSLRLGPNYRGILLTISTTKL